MENALLLSLVFLGLIITEPAKAQTPAQTDAGTVVTYPKAKKKKKAKTTLPSQTHQKATSSSAAGTGPVPVTPVEGLNKISQGNSAVQKMNMPNDRCAICEQIQASQSAGVTSSRAEELLKMRQQFESANVSKGAVEFTRNEYAGNTGDPICGSRGDGYNVCMLNGETIPSQFRLTNKTGTLPREWTFEFPGQARQNVGLFVADTDDNAFHKTKITYMMVFPRRYVPSTRIEGDKQIVTLATGETVTFDAKTKKITDGVLNESKSYSGNGVVIRADRNGGHDPRFGKGSATITNGKDGKTCKVPLKSLWPDQSEGSSLHFKFATDQAFNEFLKKQKCGFSVSF